MSISSSPVGRWISFTDTRRPSRPVIAKVVGDSPGQDGSWIVETPADPPLTMTHARQSVRPETVDFIFPHGETWPGFASITKSGIETRPCFEWDGERIAVQEGRLVNKPSPTNGVSIEDSMKGETLLLKIEQQFPAVIVGVEVEDILDKNSVMKWLLGPGTSSCSAPRVLQSYKDPGLRALMDRDWEPFRIAFAGKCSVSVLEKIKSR